MSLKVEELRNLLRQADESEFAALERSLAADTRKGVIDALAAARRRLDSEAAERSRVAGLYDFERSLCHVEHGIIVGLDEVGRGAVAGPLAVGAVVLPLEPQLDGLDDSKRLKPERRRELADSIKEHALAWAVCYVEAPEIDALGMTASLRRAFLGALGRVEGQGIRANLVLVDGRPLHIDQRELSMVKGDSKCASIAAASVVAKVERDALMERLSSSYPGYAFDENKGYASPQHIEAIKEQGLSELHRSSFCRSFLQESLF